MISERTQRFVDENGEWTAMAIKLADGTYTKNPAVDYRLKRLVQCAENIVKKPLSECRVLDLACLEGHYAIEFALHGAEALGIEFREVNLDKCNYAKMTLGLSRVQFVKDDVRNLSLSKYGTFDIVICSGILYHLRAQDLPAFIQRMGEVCTGAVLIDTFVSLEGRESVSVGAHTLRGHRYFEHDEGDDARTRAARLWASIDNASSFWLTTASLVNLLTDVGFTSVVDVLSPTMPGNSGDRKTYVAVKGARSAILSSDPTESAGRTYLPEGNNARIDASQHEPGPVFRFAKRALPPRVKNLIKPALRAILVLPPDSTPEFMKRKDRV